MGSNFSDLGQKGVPFFLRTIQHCHLLTLKDEPAGPPSALAHVHMCHVQEKCSHSPFQQPAVVSLRALALLGLATLHRRQALPLGFGTPGHAGVSPRAYAHMAAVFTNMTPPLLRALMKEAASATLT